MRLQVENGPIEGLLVLTPHLFEDERGYLTETYRQDRYREAGINCDFVQENRSYSIRGVLRGLHAQLRTPQAKLIEVISGEIFDIALDARPQSPTFGQWRSNRLSANNKKQLFIPEGFFHGFCVLSETALVQYKCSALYDPTSQTGIIWNDPDLQIDWPLKEPLLSEKDKKNISWVRFQKDFVDKERIE